MSLKRERSSTTTPRTRLSAAAIVVALGVAACGSEAATESGGGTVAVDIGYQSKTINTVTAGTLLREQGIFEEKLDRLGTESGVEYTVEWHDFASGPPLTAQMLAGQVDIGSMGDYPILVNGAETADHPDVRSELIAVTGYNARGSLNQVVVPVESSARALADLEGGVVSTSVGSAAHGMLVAELSRAGLSSDDVQVLNQEPAVGASALEGRQVDALAQFVPWPQSMIFSGEARLLHDGGEAELPTFHAVVSNKSYGEEHPEVVQAFLESMQESTEYLNRHPLEAAQQIAEITGLPAEVIYLYNGPNGLVSFDLTIKDELVEALERDLPFLRELGSLEELDLGDFINDGYVRDLLGDGYESQRDDMTSPSPLTGTDPVCGGEVSDPATASEVWFDGAEETSVAVTPTCLLRQISETDADVRAAYVPDAATGTRIFAASATWVLDPEAGDEVLVPFAAVADAEAYAADHPGSSVLDYHAALAEL